MAQSVVDVFYVYSLAREQSQSVCASWLLGGPLGITEPYICIGGSVVADMKRMPHWNRSTIAAVVVIGLCPYCTRFIHT